MHATGRSAAFWLAHYGGMPIIPLTMASRLPLEQGWPTGERSWLRQRGAIVIGQAYRHLWDAMSAETDQAPRRKPLNRAELESSVPGLSEGWDFGLHDTTCADIDVAGLHNACLAQFQRQGGVLMRSTALRSARRWGDRWVIEAGDEKLSCQSLVNAAGAWADEVARRCGVQGLNLTPLRRTVVQLRIGRGGLKDVPLVIDGLGRFYFKGESDNRVWVSPHDETASRRATPLPKRSTLRRRLIIFNPSWTGRSRRLNANGQASGPSPRRESRLTGSSQMLRASFGARGRAGLESRRRRRLQGSQRRFCSVNRRTRASRTSIRRSMRRAGSGESSDTGEVACAPPPTGFQRTGGTRESVMPGLKAAPPNRPSEI